MRALDLSGTSAWIFIIIVFGGMFVLMMLTAQERKDAPAHVQDIDRGCIEPMIWVCIISAILIIAITNWKN